jgi:hypothetical protein
LAAFNGITRGIRVLSRLQLTSDQLARVNPGPYRDPGRWPPEVVFYTGCNAIVREALLVEFWNPQPAVSATQPHIPSADRPGA